MKKILLFSTIAFLTFAIHSTLTITVKAVSFHYPQYNVDVSINKDSSFEVKETAIYNVYGEFHGLRRDLTLSDPNRDKNCSTTSNLYCGGFDRVVVNSVHDLNGNDITKKVTLYKVTDDSTNKESLRFEWEIFPDGENQNGDQFGWVLDYTVYGGIANIESSPYFYWNMLPEEKSGSVDVSNLSVTLPVGATYRKSDLQIYSDYNYNLTQSGNKLNFKLTNLPSYAPFTIAYKFTSDEVQLPGQISYNLSPAFGTKIYLDNVDVTDQVNGIIKSVPVGTRVVRFEHIGYDTLEKTLNVESSKTQIIDANLSPKSWMQVLLLLNNIICLCGCLFIPISLVGVYMYYKRHGTDVNMPKTIIPLFKPPVGASPYLVGTIADEEVNKEDIVGTIIDLAYRGYLKIKEIEKDKNYELTQLDGKEGDAGLNEVENQIYSALFKSGDVVETKDLGKTFPTDYFRIQEKIYQQIVADGYFTRSPRTTIGIYASLGVVTLIFGLVTSILVTIILISFLGILTVFTPGLILAAVGLALISIAKFMPAKTEKGSKLYAEILGFKMYMNTAERYTVQKLQPEDFVKYLSYAIVFKIEKQWAKNFEGIYKGVPEWYEGTGDIYDAIWISSFARSFSNSAVTSMTPISSGSSSGSGWSGGGSFGGFSGGGGGGGSSGGW